MMSIKTMKKTMANIAKKIRKDKKRRVTISAATKSRAAAARATNRMMGRRTRKNEQLNVANSKSCKKQAFGISDEFKELLVIPCSTKSSKNKSKGPKLLFNQSAHSLPINVVQTNSSYNQYYVHTKYVVCTILRKPHYEVSSGYLNSKIS